MKETYNARFPWKLEVRLAFCTIKRKYKNNKLSACLHACKMASGKEKVREFWIDLAFHLGYQGIELPKTLRRYNARNEFHLAWLSGFYGGAILKVLERNGWEN